MRLVIGLALPVGVLVGAVGVMMVTQLAHGPIACTSWLSILSPYCW